MKSISKKDGALSTRVVEEYLLAHENTGITLLSHQIVLRHGRYFRTVKSLPPEVRKGERMMCYKNCADFVIENPYAGYYYCEGYALRVIPVQHAWLVDAEGSVYDPTWDESGFEYFGIAFARGFLGAMLLEAGYYGLLDDYRLMTATASRFENPNDFKAPELSAAY